MLILWAALSGACFALIPVAINMAAGRNVEPRHLLMVAMPLCALVMLPGALVHPAPLVVWLTGIGIGGAQFGAIMALRWGLRFGPMAPLWCAQLLGFVVAVLWCWWNWSEELTVGRLIAVLAAVASVIAAAWQVGGNGNSARRSIVPYAVALVAVWLLNGATNAAFKELSMQPCGESGNLMSVYGDLLLVLMYATIGIGAAADLVWRPARAPVVATIGYAAMLAGGSLGGLALLRWCLSAPASLVFTINTASSLLAAIALAWLFWRERPTLTGWISLACALVAVMAAAW
ncbi:MAG: hypothetical protein AAB263_18175 [Planctomycetota bacterium]